MRFADEVADRFFAGGHDAGYRARLIADFEDLLPETPPWKTG